MKDLYLEKNLCCEVKNLTFREGVSSLVMEIFGVSVAFRSFFLLIVESMSSSFHLRWTPERDDYCMFSARPKALIFPQIGFAHFLCLNYDGYFRILSKSRQLIRG
ncbi:hypothetical protein F5884DRAFT_460573 [Xylogone sp. PMI_703]|nr:hypothetical protein F5884DRAFT_460573 [Xylogone sp. PMI_703]